MTTQRTGTTGPALEDILQTLRSHLPELRETYRVKSLGVFGSYVRGEQRRRSDVDVLVEFDEAPSMFRFIDLQERLAALLGVKVDLVMRTALKPAIGARIIAEVVAV
jgi:predicted nucleotidyltransferase